MRDIAVKSLAIIAVGLFVLSGQDLMAQKKSKSGHHVLMGRKFMSIRIGRRFL
jgi:hypothetical protein